MKRSEINAVIREAILFFEQHQFKLPHSRIGRPRTGSAKDPKRMKSGSIGSDGI